MDEIIERFRVGEGETVDLSQRPTRVAKIYESKKDYKAQLKDQVNKLAKEQEKFYAADSYALLLIFQAMDTGGKDGAIRHVMSGVNPQGTEVSSFKQPSATELDHDFLWRTAMKLPERGRIGIFNRSYYEEVLVVRVHPKFLQAQKLPEEVLKDDKVWEHRFRSIAEHERHLHANGTRIVKFFLHLSPEEQSKRFLARIDEPDKRWKFSPGDVDERGFWDDYMAAYEKALSATSTADSPWFIVPADDKKNARLFVSHIILDTIDSLKVDYPSVSPEALATMMQLREKLVAETV